MRLRENRAEFTPVFYTGGPGHATELANLKFFSLWNRDKITYLVVMLGRPWKVNTQGARHKDIFLKWQYLYYIPCIALSSVDMNMKNPWSLPWRTYSPGWKIDIWTNCTTLQQLCAKWYRSHRSEASGSSPHRRVRMKEQAGVCHLQSQGEECPRRMDGKYNIWLATHKKVPSGHCK